MRHTPSAPEIPPLDIKDLMDEISIEGMVSRLTFSRLSSAGILTVGETYARLEDIYSICMHEKQALGEIIEVITKFGYSPDKKLTAKP